MISVIIPLHNNEMTISRLFKSIIGQTYKNYEIIFIDDGSIDHTVTILEKLIKNKKRFFIFKQRNMGPFIARKLGIKKSRGNYLTFVDGDDWLASDYLKVLYQNLLYFDADISVVENYLAFNSNNKVVVPKKNQITRLFSKDKIILAWISGKQLKGFLHSKLIKRSLLTDLDFEFNSNYMEDEAMLTHIIPNVNKIVYSSKPCYYYLQRSTSITHSGVNSSTWEGLFNSMLLLKQLIQNDQECAAWELRYVGEVRNVLEHMNRNDFVKYKPQIQRANSRMKTFEKRRLKKNMNWLDRCIFDLECHNFFPYLALRFRSILSSLKYYAMADCKK